MGCQVRISMALWYRLHTMPATLPVVLAEVLPSRCPHIHSQVDTPGHAFQPHYGSSAPCLAHGHCLPFVQAMVLPRAEMTTSHNHPAPATSTTCSPSQSRCAATVRHRAHFLRVCCYCRLLPDCMLTVWAQLQMLLCAP